jgi:hypothetical protein
MRSGAYAFGLLVFVHALGWQEALAEESKPPAPEAKAAAPAGTPGPPGNPSPGPGEQSVLSDLYGAVEEVRSGERQWFLPGRSRGSIGFIFTDQKWETAYNVITGPGTEERRSITIANRLMTEYFTARHENFSILAPQLANGSFALLGGLQQYHVATNGVPTDQDGALLGYEFAMNFVDESPYPANVYANREKSTVTLPLGGTEDIQVENRGITFRWLDTSFLREREILPYFSASLQALQEHTVSTTTLAGQRLTRNDDRDELRLAADNGGETSDLSFRYILTRYKDRYYETNSYEDHNALLDYSLDFGPNLNRTWISDLQYRSSSGSQQALNTELDVRETLSVAHYTNLSSSYYYTYTRQDSSLGVLNAHAGTAEVQYAIFDNLSADLAATGLRSEPPQGSFDAVGGQGSLNYSHWLPWEGSLNASGGYSYVITDSHVPGGTAPVVDAEYVAPSYFGLDQQILLHDLFIVAPSIQVIAVKKDGARLRATEGVDYVVTAEGYRTYVQPLPTSLVIQPKDPLRISYIYNVPPQLKFRTTTRNATVGGSWPWFSVNYTRSESDSVPLEGGDPSQLVTFRSDQVDVGLNGAWRDFLARADARYYRYDSTGLSYQRSSATELLTWSPTPNLSCQLSASQYQLDYSEPARTSRGESVQAGFTYYHGQWNANGYALWRNISDTLRATEKYEEAGIRWQGQWGKLSLGASAYGSRRLFASAETRGVGGQFSVLREF